MRAEAVSTLARLPGSETSRSEWVQAVGARLEDDHPEVRAAAAAALGDLFREGSPIPAALRTRLKAGLHSSDEGFAFEAAYALATMREAEARPYLQERATLSERRTDVIEALARLGDAAALPTLAYLRKRWSTSWSDRLAATAASAALGDSSALEALRKALRSWRVEVRTHAAALAGQRQLEALTSDLLTLSQRRKDVAREAAIEALLRMEPGDIALPFQIWSEDSELSPQIRQIAQARRDARPEPQF